MLVDFWYKYKQVSPPDTVTPLDHEGRGNTRTSPFTETASGIGAIKGVDYANGVRLLYSLSDTFVGYSQQPPSKSYEDYQSAEAQVKHRIFSNKLDADPKVIEMMENFIKKIRGFVSLGNRLRDLWGGDGRPNEKMLREWDQELTGIINQTVSRIRLLR